MFFFSRILRICENTDCLWTWKNLKQLKKLVFHKHASSVLKSIFSKSWRCLKSRCLTGVLFFALFSTSEEIVFRTICDFFIRLLPSVLDFKLMSVHFRKKTWKRQHVHPDFWNPVSKNQLTNFVLSSESFFWKCENENWKKSPKIIFFSKQSSVPEASSFDNRFKNNG